MARRRPLSDHESLGTPSHQLAAIATDLLGGELDRITVCQPTGSYESGDPAEESAAGASAISDAAIAERKPRSEALQIADEPAGL